MSELTEGINLLKPNNLNDWIDSEMIMMRIVLIRFANLNKKNSFKKLAHFSNTCLRLFART
jgi:hypothetical protein